MISAYEFTGQHRFFPFGLQLPEFQESLSATAGKYSAFLNPERAWTRGLIVHSAILQGTRDNDFQKLASKIGISSRPGLKSSQTVVNFNRPSLKINQSVFLFKQG